MGTWPVSFKIGSDATAPYDLDSASEYPAAGFTAFRDINIRTGSITTTGSWQPPTDYVTNFGEHSVLRTDSTTGGEVEIHYPAVAAKSSARV